MDLVNGARKVCVVCDLILLSQKAACSTNGSQVDSGQEPVGCMEAERVRLEASH